MAHATRVKAQAVAERRTADRLHELAQAVRDRLDGPSCRDRRHDEARLIAEAEAVRARARQLEAADSAVSYTGRSR